jgi:hypothetical protein
MKMQHIFFCLAILLSITILPICCTQAQKQEKLPDLNGVYIGVSTFSDTVIQIHDYYYVKESNDWQRLTTILVSNREFSLSAVNKTKTIQVHESDIYVIDFFYTRRVILPMFRTILNDSLFRSLYDNSDFVPEPNEQDVIERWGNKKNTEFTRFRLNEMKLAIFEVDYDSLNHYLTFSRYINSESKSVKIGFPIVDDFIE